MAITNRVCFSSFFFFFNFIKQIATSVKLFLDEPPWLPETLNHQLGNKPKLVFVVPDHQERIFRIINTLSVLKLTPPTSILNVAVQWPTFNSWSIMSWIMTLENVNCKTNKKFKQHLMNMWIFKMIYRCMYEQKWTMTKYL